MQLELDRDRLQSELEELASFSDAPAPAVTRIVFTDADLAARAWLKRRLEQAGLEIREDPVGNTFARWPSTHPNRPAIATGSHIDAIPNAGRYDGTAGVLGALEAIRALKRAGFEPSRPIELIVFTAEEPTRFGIGCLGSRLLSGALSADQASALRDPEGRTLDEVRARAGFRGDLGEIALPGHSYGAFLELHIEQGPLLDQEKVPLGLVTNIAAPASLRVTLHGEGGHAGAVLMPNRRDALSGAAEIILEVERLARTSGSTDTVATTGLCSVFPGAVNSIPSRVSLALDVRDIDLARRDRLIASLTQYIMGVAEKRRLHADSEILNADAPAHCDPAILNTLRAACLDQNVSHREMVSRAYHDSLFLSRIAPTAMLFIPCRGGISHTPEEFASMDDIAAGVRVLAQALARLSSAPVNREL